MAYRIKNHRLAEGQSNVPYVQSPNVGGALNPQFLVIHYTASGPGSDIAKYFAKPSAKVSAPLVIARKGNVTQCVPFNVVGWHAGKSVWTDRAGVKHVGLNSNSIGIEIENWGPLRKTGAGWVSWTGAAVDSGKVIEARHKYGTPDGGWEIFTEAQVEATLRAAIAICDEYGIEEIVGHDDIAPGRKSDPGPAWKMDSFRAKVLGRSDNAMPTFVIRSPTGLNIRSGPGIEYALVKPNPLADGTQVLIHEANGNWRLVSVLDPNGQPDFTGWVHGGFLSSN